MDYELTFKKMEDIFANSGHKIEKPWESEPLPEKMYEWVTIGEMTCYRLKKEYEEECSAREKLIDDTQHKTIIEELKKLFGKEG